GRFDPRVEAYGVDRAEDATHHLRQTLSREPALGVRLPERLGEGLTAPLHHVELDATLLVEPRERELPARGRAPVGHHPARITPPVLEPLLQHHPLPPRLVP